MGADGFADLTVFSSRGAFTHNQTRPAGDGPDRWLSWMPLAEAERRKPANPAQRFHTPASAPRMVDRVERDGVGRTVRKSELMAGSEATMRVLPSVKLGSIVCYRVRHAAATHGFNNDAAPTADCPAIVLEVKTDGTLHLAVFTADGIVRVPGAIHSPRHADCWCELHRHSTVGKIVTYRTPTADVDDEPAKPHPAIVRAMTMTGGYLVTAMTDLGFVNDGPLLIAADGVAWPAA